MKVLIADDDMVSRRLLEATLTRWGYEVVVTHDGIEAWEVLRGADAPLLAILDWMMPGMDGVELCRRIRAREHTAKVPIIMLSALNDAESMKRALAAGALLAIGVTRWIRSLLFEVRSFDAVTVAAAVATLALTSWLASYLPARRAAGLDLVRTLRDE